MQILDKSACKAVLLTAVLLVTGYGEGFESPTHVPAAMSEKMLMSPLTAVTSAGARTVAVGQRGHVAVSEDGGRTWRKTLFRDARTAAVDLSIDSKNPNVIYAALWEAYRVEYQMSSGGPGSGLFKSTDGGESWQEITRNKGLPAGVIGRIGVSVSGADSNRVYALVENQNGGLFSSSDGGTTWTLVNDNRSMRHRAFYYTHVIADPADRPSLPRF